jgi:prepilin-type N-terminal cleavage/methylation domain-containing protein
MFMSIARSRRVSGFTLVELLVVIGIIALLVGILIPVLGKAKDSATALKCQSNEHQLMTAFLAFATDHNGYLPGNKGDRGNPVEWKRDWLFGSQSIINPTPPTKGPPESGTVYKYLKNKDVYRCPAQIAVFGAGGESNGYFDYAVWQEIAGARIENVVKAEYTGRGTPEYVPMPIILEEGAENINAGNKEGGHSNIDAMSHIHKKGSYYAAIDGSISFFIEKKGTDCHSWFGLAPSGKWVTLANDQSFGDWNKF